MDMAASIHGYVWCWTSAVVIRYGVVFCTAERAAERVRFRVGGAGAVGEFQDGCR